MPVARRPRALELLLAAGLLLPSAIAGAQDAPSEPVRDVSWWARAAQAALAAGDRAEFLRLSRETWQRAPAHPAALYGLARAHALAGAPDSALALLERVARMGDARQIDGDTLLASLRADPAHAARLDAVAAALAANRAPVVRGTVAFEIADADLVPEALAHDPASAAFLVGSMARRTVVRVRPAGAGDTVAAEGFLPSGGDLLRVIGVQLDTARGRLWFATLEPGAPDAARPEARAPRTRLHAVDARTGAPVGRWAPTDGVGPHLLNDLVVTADGDVYVTDIGASAVYRLRAGADSLELFVRPGPEHHLAPNGIALAGDGRRLYVAFLAGIAAVDLATREVAYLELPEDVTTAGIDGLAWHDGALVAVQTQPSLTRVVRFHLDAAGDRVTRAETLVRAHPRWAQPTTGTVVGDRFYYVGASGVGRLANDGTLAPAEGTTTPIFRVELRHP